MVIAAVGEGYCFLIDGISYIAVIISLLPMRITVPQARRPQREVMHELKEGWQYVRGSLPIRSILMNLGLVSMFGMPVFGADADFRRGGAARRAEHAGISDVGGWRRARWWGRFR